MAPKLLFDISKIDLDTTVVSVEQIEAVNPHRGDMRLLDGFVHCTDDFSEAIAFKDAKADEFWVPGHIPGRPLFPGVLMIEAAAQVASYLTINKLEGINFLGFTGADNFKFRGQVVPGDRLYILCKEEKFKPRRSTCLVQGIVNGNLAFEGKVTGMAF